MDMSEEMEKQNVAAERRDARVDFLLEELYTKAHRITCDIDTEANWVDDDLKNRNLNTTMMWVKSLGQNVIKLATIVGQVQVLLEYRREGTL